MSTKLLYNPESVGESPESYYIYYIKSNNNSSSNANKTSQRVCGFNFLDDGTTLRDLHKFTEQTGSENNKNKVTVLCDRL